jgi:hypothetical protein
MVSKYKHSSIAEFKNRERELHNLTDQWGNGYTDLLFNDNLPNREINRIKRHAIRDYCRFQVFPHPWEPVRFRTFCVV